MGKDGHFVTLCELTARANLPADWTVEWCYERMAD